VTAVRDVSAAIGEVNAVATAIAAAVEQQASATREIAASVQTVTVATQDATRAMQDVASISEATDVASAKVMAGAADVGRDADALRGQVTQFLQAMANTFRGQRLPAFRAGHHRNERLSACLVFMQRRTSTLINPCERRPNARSPP
jgi:methyl-accepting chemotaxis protein